MVNEINKDFIKDQKNTVRIYMDDLLSKVKILISKLKDLKNENILLKENIKNLNLKISELKLQHTKLNTEIINKDKEISDLKNYLSESSRINTLILSLSNHFDAQQSYAFQI